jgi:hypothetical protein
MAEMHARSDDAAERALAEVLGAYELQDTPPPERPVLIEVVG